MNAFPVVVLWMIMAFAFLDGSGSRSSLAQQRSGGTQSAEKLPPDIHPESLSRMPRLKQNDFTTDKEKQAFGRLMILDPKQKALTGPLGPTGTRMAIPEVAEIYEKYNHMIIHDADSTLTHKNDETGLERNYIELATLVAAREFNDKSSFLGHASRGQVSQKAVDVIKKNQDTKGLEEKEALIIQFGRELYRQPRVSSKTFADVERNFGRKGTLGITLILCYYTSNALLMRAYDQRNPERDYSPPW
jgi:hypothetical protein